MAHLATDAKHTKIYLLNPIMGSLEQQSCMFGYLFQLHGKQDILCQTVQNQCKIQLSNSKVCLKALT